MKKLIFGIFIILISCKKADGKTEPEKVNIEENENKGTKYLTYEQFKNSKWTIGEVGLNGEKPDTIIFNNIKTLSYISKDTGEEKCKYSFVKDTLIFTSHFTEFDTESNSEITSEIVFKLHYQNNSFKYIYSLQKKSNEKLFKFSDLEKYNIVFRKIKTR